MTASGWTWLVAAALLAGLDWLAVARGARSVERCAKPAVLGCLLIVAALAQPTHPGVRGWVLAALAFGLAGDIALSLLPGPAMVPVPVRPVLAQGAEELPAGALPAEPAPTDRLPPVGAADGATSGLFLTGLACFLLGHLGYAVAMLHFGTDPLSVAFGLILALIALGAFGYRIIAGAHAAGGVPMTLAVTAYIVALGSAVVLGIGTTDLWVAYGIVLFAVSDLVLASDRFVQARTWSPLTVMITYHLAQGLLLIGLVR